MAPPRFSPPGFYFGAMSPYSWLAAERIEALLPEARWRAVFAGAIFKESGRSSWGLGEERSERMADCEARAGDYGLGPIRWPAPWPTSDLLIARAMTFASRAGASTPASAGGGGDDELLRALALAAMRLAFLEGCDLGEAETVLEAAERAGLDRRELREALVDPEVKQALRESTDEALALGVFGVPTVAIEAELYWGDDRLPEAATAYRSRQSA
jgi:2-hydroxychromene-2-carboxylate isomerase